MGFSTGATAGSGDQPPQIDPQRRILPLLTDPGNRQLLHEWLQNHNRYESVAIQDSIKETEFDLCIVDHEAFRQHFDELSAKKETHAPVLLPYLLLSETEPELFKLDQGTVADNVFTSTIDEIVSLPIKQVELEWRLKALFRLRDHSRSLRERERSLRRFRRAVEATGHAVFITDPDGEIQYVNPSFEATTGYSAEEAIGETPQLLDSGEHDAEYFEELWNTILTGEVWEEEIVNQRKSGETYDALQTIAPIMDGSGEIESFVAVHNDITARKRLERDLRESEELHRVTLSNITDTVLITDDDGQFSYVCPNVHFIFGYAADTVRQLGTIESLLGEKLVETEDLEEEGVVENINHEVTDASGEEHAVLVTVKAVSIQGGTRLYSIRDVTERKQQEQRFQAFVEQSSDIITVLEEDGTIDYVSPSIERVFGYDPDQLIGTNAFELIHPDDRESLVSAFATGSTDRAEYRTRAADGTWRWAESRSTLSPVLGGRYVINTRDINERVEAERDLQRTKESRSLALQAANAGVWEWDVRSGEINWDESTEQLFGLDPGTFEGTFEAFIERVHPDDRRELRTAIDQSLRWADASNKLFRIIRDDGVERWIDARWRVETNVAGDPIRLVGVDVDVTEHQQRLQQLKILGRVLRHNVHNDMNVIRGYGQIIRDESRGRTADHAALIVDQSNHLLSTVDKERTITGTLSQPSNTVTVDISHRIDQVVARIRATHPAANVTLDRPDRTAVSANSNIDRAIHELVENAIIHNDQTPPMVAIDVDTIGDRVRVRISDNGPAIPEMNVDVLFARSEEPLYHGSGLGLWLVHWIVRRSNGSLEFDRNDPRGNEVAILLPAAE